MNRSTSLYLDIVRPLAALAVLMSHFSYGNLAGPRWGNFGRAGPQAVDVFFVLSGFVIAHVYRTREQDASSYFISRAARIYSVALPALLLTWIVDGIGRHLSPGIYLDGPYQPYTPGLLLRSVLFLGEQWNTSRYPGSNIPYWSLGFEVWYYVAFGAFVFAPRRWRWWVLLAVLAFIGPKVALMFPAWLMGVAAYEACGRERLSRPVAWACMLVPVALFALVETRPYVQFNDFDELAWTQRRWFGAGQHLFLSALFATHVVGFSSLASRGLPWLERHARRIRWVSGATFSIYLAHLPIMYLLFAMFPQARNSAAALSIIPATIAACFLFAQIGERRKDDWKSRLTQVLDRALRLVRTA